MLFVWRIWVTLNGVSAHEEHFNSFTYEVPFGLKASLLYKTHSHVIVSFSVSIYLHSVMKSFLLLTHDTETHPTWVDGHSVENHPPTADIQKACSECVISFRAIRSHYPISLCSILSVSCVYLCLSVSSVIKVHKHICLDLHIFTPDSRQLLFGPPLLVSLPWLISVVFLCKLNCWMCVFCFEWCVSSFHTTLMSYHRSTDGKTRDSWEHYCYYNILHNKGLLMRNSQRCSLYSNLFLLLFLSVPA